MSEAEESEEVLPVEPGALLAGKYRVERLLASGGMGSVMKARHEVLEQDVAIKVMRPTLAKNAEFAQRFLREARAAARISSDYVARVTDVDLLDDGTPFMVMEYLEGEDLAQLLDRGGRCAISEAVDYVLQALSGLQAAHGLGIVHRDLKPSNLFLAERPHGAGRRIKVLDFGISKVLEDGAPSGLKAGATTAYNAFLGTPRYMSPEQVSCAKDVDARTDLWSMGLILYNLLTAHDPFQSDTFQGVFARILTEPVTSVHDYRSDCPAQLEKVVLHCLERNRKERVATAGELIRALAPFASTRVRVSLVDPSEVAHAVVTKLERGGEKPSEGEARPPEVETQGAKPSREDLTAKLGPITPIGGPAEVTNVAAFSAERTVAAAPVSAPTPVSTEAPLSAPVASASPSLRSARTPAIAALAVVAAIGVGVLLFRGPPASKGSDAASAMTTAGAVVPAAVATAAAETVTAEPVPSASVEVAREAPVASAPSSASVVVAPFASTAAQAGAKPSVGSHAPHAAVGAKKPASPSNDDILGSRN